MLIDERYDQVTPEGWHRSAKQWLSEISNAGNCETIEYSTRVTMMKFTAKPIHLWNFIRLATTLSTSDQQRARIAIDLLERLLGKNGPEFIDCVESFATENDKFQILITAVARYIIPDDIWHRLQVVKNRAPYEIDDLTQRDIVIELELIWKAELERRLQSLHNSNNAE